MEPIKNGPVRVGFASSLGIGSLSRRWHPRKHASAARRN